MCRLHALSKCVLLVDGEAIRSRVSFETIRRSAERTISSGFGLQAMMQCRSNAHHRNVATKMGCQQQLKFDALKMPRISVQIARFLHRVERDERNNYI